MNLLPAFTSSEALVLNSAAPSFDLLDHKGVRHSLEDYRGSWLVLYFYPKDNTPSCTAEACALRDNYTPLKQEQAQILGVSIGSASSHQRFAQRHQLPFPLLIDDGDLARRYHALFQLGPIKLAKRHSFIIDPDGCLRKIYRKVSSRAHAQQLIIDIQLLKDAEV
ncbi:MAG: peroxiredoxin [Gammaproteobacteria bacterium]|nr:peroxiredoxin [Gammaproteobacteria bacterium]